MTLFYTNSTKNVMESQNQDIILYNFTETSQNLTIMTLLHANSTKRVMKLLNNDVISTNSTK